MVQMHLAPLSGLIAPASIKSTAKSVYRLFFEIFYEIEEYLNIAA